MNGHTVTLSNLSSGTYHLVLAQEIDGKVQGPQYQVLTIRIAPPFYASPWAIFVYILLIITVGYIFHRMAYNRQQYKLRTQQLRMEAREEELLNEMKLDFFTNISHEFRTPLTMILTPLDELLKEPGVEGKLRETLQLIDRNAHRLFDLINQLLDFRRLQTTRPELHAQPGDLTEFVTKICRLYDLQAQLHHITFEYGHDTFRRLLPFDALKME
ncbi:MAG: HAMP domain-containing sensor histidine kinase [Prevotella sp.]|nr:HAMP domain-containing sensor histidine kinase [Prevotella sp.]